MSSKLRIVLVLAAIIIPLDQLTKMWISANVSPASPITVIPGFFRLTHARNPGIALGMFQDVHIGVLIALTVVALALVWSFYRQIEPHDRLSAAALGFIVGGAIGNFIDRVVHQAVVDFLQFDLGLFIFPDFNVADSAIVIGVGLLLLDLVLRTETEEGVREESEAEG